MVYALLALVAVLAYLIASFSPGLIYAKKVAQIDLRQHGSKSTGATNTLRVLGAKAGLVVFVFDVGKAMLACFLGYHIMAGFALATPYASLSLAQEGGMLAGLFAIIGHNWPIYHRFQGGKGVACSVGVMVYLFPVYAFIAIAVCLLLIAVWRYVSVGSIAMLFIFFMCMLVGNGHNIVAVLWALVLFLLCVYRHKANIARLCHGTENKLGQGKKS